MTIIKIGVAFLLLITVISVSCQTVTYPEPGLPDDFDVDPYTSDSTAISNIGIQFLTQLLNSGIFQRKLKIIFDLLDLKVRLLRIGKALLTQENLVIVRRWTDWMTRFCQFLNQFLPALPEDSSAKTALLSLLLGTTNAGPPASTSINTSASVSIGGTHSNLVKRSDTSEDNVEKRLEDNQFVADHSMDIMSLTKLLNSKK